MVKLIFSESHDKGSNLWTVEGDSLESIMKSFVGYHANNPSAHVVEVVSDVDSIETDPVETWFTEAYTPLLLKSLRDNKEKNIRMTVPLEILEDVQKFLLEINHEVILIIDEGDQNPTVLIRY